MRRDESLLIDGRSSIAESSGELWTIGPGSQISSHGKHHDEGAGE
jgi:hypothetical protein